MSTLASRDAPIAALATAPGRGAVGIVRASGRDLGALAVALCGSVPPARQATLRALRDASGRLLDRALVLYFPAPHSYTGEDVLELQLHGGAALLQLVLDTVLEVGRASGLRLAEPGEFTQRAFLNGKLDLAQAEAVADLIDATTASAVRSATRALDGELSTLVNALAAQLRELRALVEATLDFPDEDIDFVRAAQVDSRVADLQARLDAALQRTRQGALLRDGMRVVLAGQPNVGKSSLLNALAGAELAIVTEVAGTTRDRVSESIQIEGVPLHVIDTAGLRDSSDPVERIGVQRSWDAIADADAVLFLHDLTRLEQPQYAADETRIARQLASHARVAPLHLWNKVDARADAAAARDAFVAAQGWDEARGLLLSARDHAGLDALRAELLRACGWQALPDGVFLARTRHVQALRDCAGHLRSARSELAQERLELLAEELRLAHEALMTITGAVSADALLGDIFGRFCIGK